MPEVLRKRARRSHVQFGAGPHAHLQAFAWRLAKIRAVDCAAEKRAGRDIKRPPALLRTVRSIEVPHVRVCRKHRLRAIEGTLELSPEIGNTTLLFDTCPRYGGLCNS